jgi:imidazolonepropionase-like amidohydrolase
MQTKSPGASRDLKLEALVPVIKGDMPLFIMANQASQIREAVAFGEKEKVKIIIATGTAAGEVKDLLKEKNVPVVLRPTLTLVRSEDEPYDLSLTLAGELSKAGVKIAFGSFGNEFARRLSQQVGNSVAYGLPYDEALKALTIYPAEMFGVGKELGTIEVGKMANLIVTNGDPLELTTEVRYLFIHGVQTSTDNRHKQLYEEYKKRP